MPRECLADARPIRPLHPPIVVHLSDRTALPPDLLDEMMREAARVWQAGGVTVQWSPGVAGAEVQVIVTRTIAESVMQAAVARRPLASILFVDGRPTTLIRVYPQEAERLLEHERLGDRPLVQRPPKLRFRLVGRALGRAIAHELGHYLFASATHTMTGLMRASHPTGHLLSSSVRNFHVIAPPPRSCTVLARRTFKN